MPDSKFLEEYGLYRKFWLPNICRHVLDQLPSPSLQVFCPNCKDERTWQEVRHHRRLVGVALPISVTTPVHNCKVAIQYGCAYCGETSLTYIVQFGSDSAKVKQAEQFLISQGKMFDVSGHGDWVMKIGQFPPWSIDPPVELRDALGEHESLYKRGTICESQGYGIGAFAYYRRIVEDMIDQLLADVANLIEPHEREKYRAALAKVEATIVAADKIEVVKDMLPTFLRPGGINPLQTLHEALSVGIHALDEEECLALAESIRHSLAMLCKHIALAKQDAEEYATKITSVKERLDKIKKKSKGK